MDRKSLDVFITCRDALTAGRPHRLWSLIITIFGDLAQAPGRRISGAALGEITELIGVKPEAMRVALHRLRKDGWLESKREGRASFHSLTQYGRTQCAEASPRIYGPGLSSSVPVHLLLADDGTPESRRLLEAHMLTDQYLKISSHAIIGLGDSPGDTGGLCVVQPAKLTVPDWLKKRICPDDLLSDYVELYQALKVVDEQLGPSPSFQSLEVAALRTLIVHSWRRVLLRHPNLPEQFFPDNWSGPGCRLIVTSLLDRLAFTKPEVLHGGTQVSA